MSERRQYLRQPMELDARLSIAGHGPSYCQVRDFCPDGLFLALPAEGYEDRVVRGQQLEVNTTVEVAFAADAGDGRRDFTLTARVAGLFKGGVGVQFKDADFEAVRALAEVARAYGVRRSDTPAVAAHALPEALLARCCETVSKYLDDELPRLFKASNETLVLRMQQAKSDAEKMGSVDARTEIERLHATVEDAFRSAVIASLRSPEVRSDTGTGASDDGLAMSLVDTLTFEDWLTVRHILERHQEAHERDEEALRRRLSKIHGLTIQDYENPVSVGGLCFAFHDALQGLGASRLVRRTIFDAFERTVVAEAKALHDMLNQALAEAGVLPQLAHPRPLVPQKPRTPSTAPASLAITSAPAASGHAAPAEASADAESAQPQPAALDEAYRAAGRLLDLQHASSADLQARRRPEGIALRDREVLEILSSPDLRSDRGDRDRVTGRLRLAEQLRERVRARNGELDRQAGTTVEIVSRLIESMLDDPMAGEGVKSCVRALARPLLEVALRDASFFHDAAHPARGVLNAIGRMELDASDYGEPADTAVRHLIGRICEAPRADTASFGEVLSYLNAIASDQCDGRRQRIEEVTASREAQQSSVAARRGGENVDWTTTFARAPDELKPWLEQTLHLATGDVLVLGAAAGAPRRVTLAWISAQRAVYQFVDAHGRKADSFTLQELALALLRAKATVLPFTSLPLLDRSLYRMLNTMHDRFAHEATHDDLTGTLNRREFEARVDKALERAHTHGVFAGLLLLELDRFDDVTKACGRKASDSLLRQLARMLEKHAGGHSAVGRHAARCFGVLVHESAESKIQQFAERQRRAIEQSRCLWHGQTLQLTASIGMAVIDRTATDAASVLRRAEHACSRAASDGGNRVRVAAPAGSVFAGSGDGIWFTGPEGALASARLALRRQRVQPLQEDPRAKPQFEILLGVRDDSGELLRPRAFIRAAESHRRMPEVDRWVVRNTIAWMAAQRTMLADTSGYSINLAVSTLCDPGFIDFVLEQLERSQVPASKLLFEINEPAAQTRIDETADFIRRVRECGCRVALDDFGSRDGSFAHLERLPADYVKIDGRLVRRMTRNPRDLAVVRAINEIGHVMKIQTIAAYVEDADTLAHLREMGVDYVQGYGIEEPALLSAKPA